MPALSVEESTARRRGLAVDEPPLLFVLLPRRATSFCPVSSSCHLQLLLEARRLRERKRPPVEPSQLSGARAPHGPLLPRGSSSAPHTRCSLLRLSQSQGEALERVRAGRESRAWQVDEGEHRAGRTRLARAVSRRQLVEQGQKRESCVGQTRHKVQKSAPIIERARAPRLASSPSSSLSPTGSPAAHKYPKPPFQSSS